MIAAFDRYVRCTEPNVMWGAWMRPPIRRPMGSRPVAPNGTTAHATAGTAPFARYRPTTIE